MERPCPFCDFQASTRWIAAGAEVAGMLADHLFTDDRLPILEYVYTDLPIIIHNISSMETNTCPWYTKRSRVDATSIACGISHDVLPQKRAFFNGYPYLFRFV